MYKCKHFKIQELVDKSTYSSNSEWKLWLAFDDRLLRSIDFLREELGVSVTINDWSWGGTNQWRGLRNPQSAYYSQWSQHSYGRAVDMIFKGIEAKDVRAKIKELMDSGKFKDLTLSLTVEDGVSWVHLDIRNNNQGFNSFQP